MADDKSLSLMDIENELKEVTAANWFLLGVHLGIKSPKLREIEKDYPRDVWRCRFEVLDWWHRNAPDVSWEKLADALGKTGGCDALSQRLRRKMPSKENLELTMIQARTVAVEENRVRSDPPLTEQFQGLELEDELMIETLTIRNKFNVLFTKVRRFLMEKGVSVKDFMLFLKNMAGYPRKSLPDTKISTLFNSSDLIDVFATISDYCSWFNHSFLGEIIDAYSRSDEEIRKAHQDFCSNLRTYCEHRVKRIPFKDGFDVKTKEGFVPMILKVDREWEHIQVKQLEEVILSLADILGVPRHALHLKTIEDGCVQLTLTIPSHIPDVVFPLTAEQEAGVVEMGVTDLQCGSYHFAHQERLEGVNEGIQHQSRELQPPPQLAHDQSDNSQANGLEVALQHSSIPTEAPHAVCMEIKSKMRCFNNLRRKAFKQIQESETPTASDLRVFVSDPSLPWEEDDRKTIIRADQVATIFAVISNHKYLNWYCSDLLEDIVKEYGSNQLQGDMEEYCAKRNKMEQRIPLENVKNMVLSPTCSHDVTIKALVSQSAMSDMRRVRNDYSAKNGIPITLCRVYKANSPLAIILLIPFDAALRLRLPLPLPWSVNNLPERIEDRCIQVLSEEETLQLMERSPSPPIPSLELTLPTTSPSTITRNETDKPIKVECICEKPPFDPGKQLWPQFEKAWKAIEDGHISTFEEVISGSPELLIAKRSITGNGVEYAITLLAFCGFHGRKDMVDLLLDKGADINAGPTCNMHGVPLSQMMLHCLAQHEYEKLDADMVEYFVQKKADLNGGIFSNIMFRYSMLDLPLAINRVDCAKALVEAGADPITGGWDSGQNFVIVPMFQEYFDYGTNEYICWLFNDYIPNHPEVDLGVITDRIAKSIINMNEKDHEFSWWKSQRRAPAHAILTCGHHNTIQLVQSKCKDIDGSLDLCGVRNFTGKTALHIAAEVDDVKSVEALLALGADTLASDNSDKNPFMLAVEKGHLTVAKAMVKKNPDLISMDIIHWALEKHLNTFFQCAFEEDLETLLIEKGVSHLAAASGNTEVFKILWSEKFAKAALSASNDEKNPLELAVEHEHVSILSTLKECIDGGKSGTTPKWHLDLRIKWLHTMRPLFLYASSCGSIDTVKYFIANGYEPNISIDGRTPLLCAANGGHYEIVAYLLQFRKVLSDLEKEAKEVDSASESPLLVAAQNGHTKCVTLLLQKGSNVLQTDATGRNCLMIAIQNHHKDTALAILSVDREGGLMALKTDQNPSSLKLLIKEMPDLAEFVLNNCVTEGSNFVDRPCQDKEVHYNFAYLDDTGSPEEQHPSHVLNWMIRYKRLKLLQHPLVENFLFHKFWRVTFPLFAATLMYYLIFLAVLMYFFYALPRPGPDSETCAVNVTATSNGNNVECMGQSEGTRRVLRVTAGFVFILNLLGFLWKLMQILNKGWKNWDNCFQVLLYTLTFIFILRFDNQCWCSTIWQWQTGAVTVFLSWFNVIFIHKYMPYAAVPINTFLSVCITFLKQIFLPVIMVFAFTIPYYMVFVRESASSEAQENLVAFGSPAHALTKTVLQPVIEFDFEATLSQGDLLHYPIAYILLFTSVITMAVLFTIILIGLTIGVTREQAMEAEFTKLQVWVEFILEGEWIWRLLEASRTRTTYRPNDELLSYSSKDCGTFNSFILRLLEKFSPENRFIEFYLKLLGKEYTRHAKIVKKLQERNANIYITVMEHVIDAVRKDITTFKTGDGTVKQDMAIFKTSITEVDRHK